MILPIVNESTLPKPKFGGGFGNLNLVSDLAVAVAVHFLNFDRSFFI